MRLQEKLTALRKEKGLTQLDLAERLNVSRQAVSRWEVGTAVPSTDNLKVLSDLYGVSVDYLLNDAAELPPKVSENRVNLEGKSKSVKYMGILLGVMGVLMIVMILVIILCMEKIRRPENLPIVVPITDMIRDPNPSIYPIETVHLIPMD